MESMPIEPGAVLWGASLGARKPHGVVELGELMGEECAILEPEVASAHAFLSSIYTTAN